MNVKRMTWILAGFFALCAVGWVVYPQADSVDAQVIHVTGEHYKCYPINPPIRVDIPVALRDQFGPSNARVLDAVELCNPVDKNNEGMINPDVHLVCYTIADSDLNRHRVRTWNQFGFLDYVVDPARKLCVPSIKELVYTILPDGTVVFPTPTGG